MRGSESIDIYAAVSVKLRKLGSFLRGQKSKLSEMSQKHLNSGGIY